MSIAEQIHQNVIELPHHLQQQVLSFVETLHRSKQQSGHSDSKNKPEIITGLWFDPTVVDEVVSDENAEREMNHTPAYDLDEFVGIWDDLSKEEEKILRDATTRQKSVGRPMFQFAEDIFE